MKKKVFAMATAHLDTVYKWPLERSLNDFIPKTLNENFKLFEKYPHYRFNFEGAYRYELMEEYYPESFEKIKEYVAQGKWNPVGSSYENGDVNVPSPEALFRNILYGNGYYEKVFGLRSRDIFLPDCFGFGYALPSIMSHADLRGFTTQKLTWGCTKGIPFHIGRWYGVDGSWVYAAVDLNQYNRDLNFDFIRKRLDGNAKKGLDVAAIYHGTGDKGGAPSEKSVQASEKAISDSEKNGFEFVNATPDELFDYIDSLPEDKKRVLPEHMDELTMIYHGAGSYTARAISKRWNKRNEILAGMCESASVFAEILGQKDYPKEAIDSAWKRVIKHQFHDDITGTSLQETYKRSWNDYGVSLNVFANEYNAACEKIVSRMDTTGDGLVVVVHNPVEYNSDGILRVTTDFKSEYVCVRNAKGQEVPSQIAGGVVLFKASVAPCGFEKYVLTEAEKPYADSALKVSSDALENQKYSVKLDKNGDICSIFDKRLGKEMLREPLSYDIFPYNGDHEFPAWTIRYSALKRKPVKPQFVSAQVIEDGAARVAVRITQKHGKSLIRFTVSLADGGEAVEIREETDWRSFRRLVKRRFSFTCGNGQATYDLGLGAISRGNNTPKCYEVPAQNWADITDKSGKYGATVFSECKFGWDKPDECTLRSTVLHAPRYNHVPKDSAQSKMEMGLNRYAYAVFSHEGAVGKETQKKAKNFVTPMTCFVCKKHDGVLGSAYSPIGLSDDGVLLRALKKSEDGLGYVVRFGEGENKDHSSVRFRLGSGIQKAVEVFASEKPRQNATVENGELVFDMKPYEVKSFLLFVQKDESTKSDDVCLALPDSFDPTTPNDNRKNVIKNTDFSLPKELWKDTVTCGNVLFETSATIADGQKVILPTGTERLFFLASSLQEGKTACFKVGAQEKQIRIAAARERLARWDLIGAKELASVGLDTVAEEFTHTHSVSGDNRGNIFYVFCYELDVSGAEEITLPQDSDIAFFGMTASRREKSCVPCGVWYDTAPEGRSFDYKDDFISFFHELKRKLFGKTF